MWVEGESFALTAVVESECDGGEVAEMPGHGWAGLGCRSEWGCSQDTQNQALLVVDSIYLEESLAS